jgi:hypothetical protein
VEEEPERDLWKRTAGRFGAIKLAIIKQSPRRLPEGDQNRRNISFDNDLKFEKWESDTQSNKIANSDILNAACC